MKSLRLDRIATVYASGPLRAAGALRTQPAIPILMYHSVSDDPEVGVASYYRITTSPARFRQQMQYLHDARYEVISLREAVRRLSSGLSSDERSVVLTFDDGYHDFRTNAWPTLRDFGFSATMFVPTAFVGRSFNGRASLAWSDLRELHGSGVVFGAHSVTHAVLYRMSWDRIRRELVDSRAVLEDQLQSLVDLFAYPFAFPQEDSRFVNRLTVEMTNAGYCGGVTTAIGRARTHAQPLVLRRIPISEADDSALFATKLSGAYDWMGRVQKLIRSGRRARAWISRSSSSTGTPKTS